MCHQYYSHISEQLKFHLQICTGIRKKIDIAEVFTLYRDFSRVAKVICQLVDVN